MNRIIINYDDDIPTDKVLWYVIQVMAEGRISGNNNESYCYCTTFKDKTVCFAKVTSAGTDVFNVERNNDENY